MYLNCLPKPRKPSKTERKPETPQIPQISDLADLLNKGGGFDMGGGLRVETPLVHTIYIMGMIRFCSSENEM